MNACRLFDERLAAAIGTASEAAQESLLSEDGHLADCPACAGLVEALLANRTLFSSLERPAASAAFLSRLAAIARTRTGRDDVVEVLSLLTPGTLSRPEMSETLRASLVDLPRTASKRLPANVVPIESGRKPRSGRSLLHDWRFGVALAYAATLLLVGVLKLDPLSAARRAGGDLTAAGERALSEARTAATARIASSRLTEKLDYRIYRTVAVGKARAAAYSSLVFDRFFGPRVETAHGSRPADTPAGQEPRSQSFRS